MDLLAAIGVLLAASWDFFTAITVPGFDFPVAVLFVAPFLALLGLRILGMALGLDFGEGSGSYGGSKGGKVKISKQREKDEK